MSDLSHDEPYNSDPIAELIENYNELNSSVIEELTEEPSPLEFMRYVAKNTPFVVRRAAKDWKAAKEWNANFLKDFLKDETVNVAVTPHGNADAPTPHPTPESPLVFAQPHEEDQPFPIFINYLTSQSLLDPAKPIGEVRYAQTQNDNLRNEYLSLFSHVPPSIPFARIALDRDPDAINLWIGNQHSTTAMHKDNYENIYVQIRGQKHFILLPPICHPCVNEQPLPSAVYSRPQQPSSQTTTTTKEEEKPDLLRLTVSDKKKVPFPTWDPDRPFENETEYSCLACPVRVTLHQGDMLYLPALWYHKVSQSVDTDGVCVAVNYWYDMDFTGPLYPLSTFVRSVYKRDAQDTGDSFEQDAAEEDHA
ncbi:cupin-like domain-containing protein [Triangularia verruculosa]|uniref:Cupin-like domain-containing protein n=1 Tax=Triangularia verruculosa TaxID=2587418 RepID=A0AAN7AW09_9PEZI|nr:cupin-like domain-containing protein [Triangularia verruculosa]